MSSMPISAPDNELASTGSEEDDLFADCLKEAIVYVSEQNSKRRRTSESPSPDETDDPGDNQVLEVDCTYTTQLNKKNKLFNDGKLMMTGNLLRLFNDYGQQLVQADVRPDWAKGQQFREQWTRAVSNGEGPLMNIFYGYLVHLDRPPKLRG
jgi:hypothetical protein